LKDERSSKNDAADRRTASIRAHASEIATPALLGKRVARAQRPPLHRCQQPPRKPPAHVECVIISLQQQQTSLQSQSTGFRHLRCLGAVWTSHFHWNMPLNNRRRGARGRLINMVIGTREYEEWGRAASHQPPSHVFSFGGAEVRVCAESDITAEFLRASYDPPCIVTCKDSRAQRRTQSVEKQGFPHGALTG
jgi:hypothetical protein